MASLASLDLTNNKLKEVPESLKDLGHLGNIIRAFVSASHFLLYCRGFVFEEQPTELNPSPDPLCEPEGASSRLQQDQLSVSGAAGHHPEREDAGPQGEQDHQDPG